MSRPKDVKLIPDTDLAALGHSLGGAVGICRIVHERAADELAYNKGQLAVVEAELARRAAARAAEALDRQREEAEEDARQLEAKRRHDEELRQIAEAEAKAEEEKSAEAARMAEAEAGDGFGDIRPPTEDDHLRPGDRVIVDGRHGRVVDNALIARSLSLAPEEKAAPVDHVAEINRTINESNGNREAAQ